jgi:hypothetical protein
MILSPSEGVGVDGAGVGVIRGTEDVEVSGVEGLEVSGVEGVEVSGVEGVEVSGVESVEEEGVNEDDPGWDKDVRCTSGISDEGTDGNDAVSRAAINSTLLGWLLKATMAAWSCRSERMRSKKTNESEPVVESGSSTLTERYSWRETSSVLRTVTVFTLYFCNAAMGESEASASSIIRLRKMCVLTSRSGSSGEVGMVAGVGVLETPHWRNRARLESIISQPSELCLKFERA